MKCPGCKYVQSDLHDVCAQCMLDLRPYKERIGIPVTHPDRSYSELVADDQAVAQDFSAKDIFGKLFSGFLGSGKSKKKSGKSKTINEVAAKPVKPEPEETLAADTAPPKKVVAAITVPVEPVAAPKVEKQKVESPPEPVPEAVSKKIAPVKEVELPEIEDLDALDTRLDNIIGSALAEDDAEDDLQSISEVLNELEEDASPISFNDASDTADEQSGSQLEENKTPPAEPKTATPQVLEFSDDSTDFDQYLDSILGDSEIQIEAVKTKKIEYAKKEEEVAFDFEVEIEGEEYEDDN